jgi:hypothetical protein
MSDLPPSPPPRPYEPSPIEPVPPPQPARGGVLGRHGVLARMSGPRVGVWMRNLALVGAAIGALGGALAGVLTHLPGSEIGMLAMRWGVAGAAMGASAPPAVRSMITVIQAFGWILLTAVLWWIAIVVSGPAPWGNQAH